MQIAHSGSIWIRESNKSLIFILFKTVPHLHIKDNGYYDRYKLTTDNLNVLKIYIFYYTFKCTVGDKKLWYYFIVPKGTEMKSKRKVHLAPDDEKKIR